MKKKHQGQKPNITGEEGALAVPMCPFCKIENNRIAWRGIGQTDNSFVYLLYCVDCGAELGMGMEPIGRKILKTPPGVIIS